MRSSYQGVIFSLVLLCFLNGCSDDARLAPVVNAWYQPHRASNTYIVRKNDTIYSIAWSFGLDYRALATANHLVPPYRVTDGQRLIMTTKPAHNAINPALMRSQPIRSASTQKPVQKMTQLASQKPVISKEPRPAEERHVSFSSRWRWPTRGPIIQSFSRKPSGHPGISIAGKLGSPIRAAANGVVVYSGDGVRGYGNLIIVKHNASYLSAYAFNQRNLVSVGEQVKAGSVIARMGQNDAGRTFLYFEIRRDGVPVNPLQYLNQ